LKLRSGSTDAALSPSPLHPHLRPRLRPAPELEIVEIGAVAHGIAHDLVLTRLILLRAVRALDPYQAAAFIVKNGSTR